MPVEMLDKLHAVLRRERRLRLQAGLARACAILLTATLVMMALDWLATPRQGPWRWIMTLSALACGAAALVLGCMIPLLHRRSLDSVAQQVDRAHPSLQERCQTVAEFARSKDAPEIRGSEGMIRKIAQQTAAMSASVQPAAVVSNQGLIRAGKFFAASAAVLALFFIVDFSRAKVLSRRFLQPGTDITLTRLQSTTGDLVAGKGENVTLEFTASGKATRSAKLYLHPTNGPDEVVVLEKDAKQSTASTSKFTYAANAVTASFDYSARSGDGQSAVSRVTVLERPTLAEVQFHVEAPAYSKLPLVNEQSLPRHLRALEGSKMEISFLPDQELTSLDLKFSDGVVQHLEKGPDRHYHFNTVLSNSVAFEPVLINVRHLDNQSRPNCEITVYQDQPPTVNIISPSDDITARPDDKIQIQFEARDDFGLTRADLVVSITSEDGSNSPPITLPIPLNTNEAGAKLIQKQVELDLAQFNLKQDQQLNYSVRVTDTKNDSSFSTPTPDAAALSQAQNSATSPAANTNSQAGASENLAQQNAAPAQADQNNPQNQTSQNSARNQSQQNAAPNQSQQNTAQNQAGQNNAAQNQAQSNTAQNQPQQNGGQNQQNTARNQSQSNTAQNESQQNAGQNQSSPNTAQNQAQSNTAQNQPQQNQAQANAAQNQPQKNSAANPSQPNTARIQSSPNTAQNQAQQNNSQSQSQPNSGQNSSQQNTAQSQSQQNTAQNSSSQPPSNQSNNQNQSSPPQQNQNHIAMTSPGAGTNAPSPSGSSQPPPNPMSQRALDAASGQSSSAQPMRIVVDQWARSFDGQMREKQEMAIEPTLKLLEHLLHSAHDLTESNLVAAQSKEGLSPQQTWALDESKDQLLQADRAVQDLKKNSAGTPYAFIGLQISDIDDSHVAPAREKLGEVTLESAKAREDKDNLSQASFHLDQALKMLADLTKNYESVKRDNQLADALQQLKKMHQIFLEETQAMLGSKKPPINSVPRQVAEVDDDYVAKLNALLEEQKKIMAELAKILADDPRMLRRFLALQELDGSTLRDQLTLLAQRQQSLTKQTAEWTVAEPASRSTLAGRDLVAQAAEQIEVAAAAAKMHENMITWLPDGVEQDKEPMATALSLAAEGARLATLASAQAASDAMTNTPAAPDAATNSPAPSDAITNSLASARKALDQFRLLHDYLPDMAGDSNTQNLSVFAANRLNEDSDLVTRESGWIKKIAALRGGDFSQSVEVDEHRLALDTATLNDKLNAAVPSLAALSPEIQAKSDQLLHTVGKQVLPEETRAVDALARNSLKDAVSRQEGADTAFADAETQFDELLRLIVAKLDTAPAPTEPGQNPTLEEILAMLKDEKKAAESLGIPNRPINVQIMRDWLSPSSGSQQASGSQGQRQNRAQARATEQQARDASRRADRATDQARRNAQLRATAMTTNGVALAAGGNETGPKSPSNAWNTIASKLGDELRQSRDNVPPEQYRQAIEQYFNSISETVPASPSDSKDKNP